MSVALLLALAGGGAAGIAALGKSAPAAPSLTSSGGSPASSGAAPGATVGSLAQNGGVVPVGHHVPAGLRSMTRPPMPTRGDIGPDGSLVTWGSGSAPVDTAGQAKAQQIEQYAKAVYNNLSADALSAGASYLNSTLGIDPPIKSTDSWETVASKVSATVGGDAGAVAGAAIAGPLGAYLGKMVGAYLGVQLADIMAQPLEDIGSWFQSRWSDVEAWVQDIGGQVISDASAAVGDISDAAQSLGSDVGDAADAAASYVQGLF